jgi:hypothetical protein
MVDYSKWDRMDFSDSDDDGDANNHMAPRVTSLDSPGRVTIGTDGTLEIGQSSVSSDKSAAAARNSGKSHASNNGEEARQEKLQKWHNQLSHNGGQHHVTITKSNTAIQSPIYWAQDRYAITFRLGFPPLLFPSKTIRVKVLGALNYKDRHSAVGSGAMSGYKEIGEDGTAFGSLEIIAIQSDGETILLSGQLPRPVYLNQDEDEVGFDIEDNLLANSSRDAECTKFVTITLPKAVPMEGMIIWWDCPLLNFPKINVSSIQERRNPERVMSVEEYNASMDRKQSATDAGGESKKEAFAKAWNEAHQMFREKVKTREAKQINVDD